MKNFIFWTFAFAIVGGLLVHFQVSLPLVSSYMGKLPGDLIIKKGALKMYLPMTSAAIASFVFCSARRLVFGS